MNPRARRCQDTPRQKPNATGLAAPAPDSLRNVTGKRQIGGLKSSTARALRIGRSRPSKSGWSDATLAAADKVSEFMEACAQGHWQSKDWQQSAPSLLLEGAAAVIAEPRAAACTSAPPASWPWHGMASASACVSGMAGTAIAKMGVRPAAACANGANPACQRSKAEPSTATIDWRFRSMGQG